MPILNRFTNFQDFCDYRKTVAASLQVLVLSVPEVITFRTFPGSKQYYLAFLLPMRLQTLNEIFSYRHFQVRELSLLQLNLLSFYGQKLEEWLQFVII